jgi:SAM-dependent methyltransferase
MESDIKFYQYEDFLGAKRELDAKYMSQRLWGCLKKVCKARRAVAAEWPRRVLDCGCGTGAMLQHLVDRRISFREYHGIDIHSGLLAQAREKMKDGVFRKAPSDPQFHAMSVYQLIDCKEKFLRYGFDLVTALSLAEHVDVDAMLGGIWSVMNDHAVLFLPINYDGGTIFEPVSDAEKESILIENFNSIAIEGQVYEGLVGGNSRCGRDLFHALSRNGFRVLEYDTENWVIYPSSTSPSYSEHVRKFLHYVINAVAEANLQAMPQRQPLVSPSAKPYTISDEDREFVESWRKRRLAQMETGSLVYICYQMGALAERVECPVIAHPLGDINEK